MNDIGIGAVGAAIIAGLISLLGLIIGKEQKVSEFRQAWVDDLRKCLVAYLVNINAIADSLRVARATSEKPQSIEQHYKLLNEANHGIRLRLNDSEKPATDLLQSMDQFEAIAADNTKLTLENIRSIEDKFLSASKELLKYEWKRVKKGEPIFYITKYAVAGITLSMIAIFSYLWCNRDANAEQKPKDQGEYSISTTVFCSTKEVGATALRNDRTRAIGPIKEVTLLRADDPKRAINADCADSRGAQQPKSTESPVAGR